MGSPMLGVIGRQGLRNPMPLLPSLVTLRLSSRLYQVGDPVQCAGASSYPAFAVVGLE
jgi:hypothetical protein